MFPPTHWSWIEAVKKDGPERRRALEELCQTYWRPLYQFARQYGLSWDRAENAVQAFYADFLWRDGFAGFDAGKGKLRTFLLACFSNAIRRQVREDQAQKRGGGQLAEELTGEEPGPDPPPDVALQQAYARVLLNAALGRVRAETLARENGARLWEVLEPLLLKERAAHGECVAAAHAQGIAHRDLKPSNILLTEAGAV